MKWLGVWLLAMAPACGGIVEGGGSRDRDPDPDPGVDPSSSSKAGSGSSAPHGDTELGECTLGPVQSSREVCTWVADGRCYTSREMACNCACPRDRDSQCISGFGGGTVSCN